MNIHAEKEEFLQRFFQHHRETLLKKWMSHPLQRKFFCHPPSRCWVRENRPSEMKTPWLEPTTGEEVECTVQANGVCWWRSTLTHQFDGIVSYLVHQNLDKLAYIRSHVPPLLKYRLSYINVGRIYSLLLDLILDHLYRISSSSGLPRELVPFVVRRFLTLSNHVNGYFFQANQDQLEELQTRFQDLFEDSFHAIYLLDEKGKIFAVNQQGVDLLGWERAELYRKNLYDLIFEDDSPDREVTHRVLMEFGVIKELELDIVNRHGETTPVEVNASTIQVDDSFKGFRFMVKDISARRAVEARHRSHTKQLEKNLLESSRSMEMVQSRFERLIEESPVAMLQLSPTGECSHLNQAAEELLGYGPDDFFGRHLSSILPDEDGEKVKSHFASIVDQGYHSIQTTVTRGDDDQIQVKINSIPIYSSDDSEVVGFRSFMRDITHEVRTQKELVKKIQELTLLDEIGAILQTTRNLDQVLYIVLVAITAGQGLGFNRAFVFLSDEDKHRVEGKLAVGPMSGDEASNTWKQIRNADPTFRELLEAYKTSINLDSPINNLIRSIQIPLSEKDNLLVQALESHRSYIYYSDHILEIPGWEEVENVDTPSEEGDDPPGENSVEPKPPLGNWEAEEEPVEDKSPTPQRKDPDPGKELADKINSHSYAIVPLLAQKRSIGLLVVDNFINRRRLDPDAIQLLRIFSVQVASVIENSVLYAKIQEKVATLHKLNQEIRENQVRMLHAERLSTLGETAATVAHEIRTPLVSIGGFARSILRGNLSEENRTEFLGIIVNEVRRLETLLTELLSYARAMEPTLEPTDLHELIEQCVLMIKNKAEESHIEVHTELASDIKELNLDKDQLRQAILNILDNAIQVMSDGGEIRITTARKEGAMEISIFDTGPGIEETNIKKLFQPFFTTRRKGSGLGLAIAAKVLEQHRGSIQVETEVGRGTTFILSIPL